MYFISTLHIPTTTKIPTVQNMKKSERTKIIIIKKNEKQKLKQKKESTNKAKTYTSANKRKTNRLELLLWKDDANELRTKSATFKVCFHSVCSFIIPICTTKELNIVHVYKGTYALAWFYVGKYSEALKEKRICINFIGIAFTKLPSSSPIRLLYSSDCCVCVLEMVARSVVDIFQNLS